MIGQISFDFSGAADYIRQKWYDFINLDNVLSNEWQQVVAIGQILASQGMDTGEADDLNGSYQNIYTEYLSIKNTLIGYASYLGIGVQSTLGYLGQGPLIIAGVIAVAIALYGWYSAMTTVRSKFQSFAQKYSGVAGGVIETVGGGISSFFSSAGTILLIGLGLWVWNR